jgi:DUF1680 family protein
MTSPRKDRTCWCWAALWFLLLPCLGIPEAHATVPASPTANSPSHARIPGDLPLDAVKWIGGFWQDRMQRLRDMHLPGVLDGSFMSVENGSTFLNLLRAAKLEKGGAQGSTWSDGDCYLVLDTVARLQAYQPDAYLKSTLDRWIPIVAQIQLEDGLVDSWTVLGEFDAMHGKPWRSQSLAQTDTSLYREACFAKNENTLAPGDRLVTVSLIPYYARLNRKSDYFRIWLPVY